MSAPLIQPPSNVDAAIKASVARDLQPSMLTVHLKLASAFLGGLVLSLAVCGQFGLAFSGPAAAFSHHIHHHMPATICAIVCGALYSLFPIAVLRLGLTSPLEFRAMLGQHTVAVAIWYVAIGSALGTLGHHGNDIISVGLWIATALVTGKLIAMLAHAVLPFWNLQAHLRMVR